MTISSEWIINRYKQKIYAIAHTKSTIKIFKIIFQQSGLNKGGKCHD